MKIQINRSVLLSIILVCQGCVTIVSGEKANQTNEGIRYNLPAPHLLVTPLPNGTVKVEPIYLPDPQNEYVIDVWSIFSDYTIDIETVGGGLLKQVNLKETTVAPAVKAIQSAATIGEQLIKNKQLEEQNKISKQQAIQTARIELAEEKAKLALFKKPPPGVTKTPNQIFDQELLVSKKKIALQVLLNGSAENNPFAAANDPRGDGFETVPGPILFRILPDGEGVKLVAVEQKDFAVISSDSVESKQLQFTPDGIIRVTPHEISKELKVTLTANLELESIDTTKTKLVDPLNLGLPVAQGDEISATIIPSDNTTNRKRIEVILPKGTKPGDYKLFFGVKAKGLQEKRITKKLKIVKPGS